MRERSLAFLIPGDLSAATGGYGYDRRMIEGLRQRDWKVVTHVLHSSFPVASAKALEHADQTLAQLPAHSLVLIDGLAAGAMPDVLHAHGTRLNIVGLVHHPLDRESNLPPALKRTLGESERRALQAMCHVIVTSAATRSVLGEYGVEASRISVVEPGTDSAPLARRHYGGSLNLLCVATLTPRKGHDLLFAALASLTEFAWHLTCAGSLTRDVPTTRRLQSQLQHLQLSDRVELVGELDSAALSHLYMQSDLFVLPTRYEGFGMAVAEALAHGLPVISSSVGAIPELVGASAGLLFAAEDLTALRQALNHAFRNPSLLGELAAGARVARARLPDWNLAGERMARVIELQNSTDGR